MAVRVGTDHLDGLVTQVRDCPHRTMLGVYKVGATTRVRDLAYVNQCFQVTVLGINNSNFVGVVGRRHEVTHAAIPAAIVQEFGCINGGDVHVVQIFVVGQQGLAGLFYVDDELRVRMGRHDGGNTRLRMVFLVAHGHATGARVLLRLQGVAVHDHELGRPVGAGNGVLVFPASVHAGLDRTSFHTNLDLGYDLRLLHPQADHVDQGVTPDNHDISARARHPGDVHHVAGFDDLHGFPGTAVNHGNLTG